MLIYGASAEIATETQVNIQAATNMAGEPSEQLALVTAMEVAQAEVADQQRQLPALYGGIDFSAWPERFSGSLGDVAELPDQERRSVLLARPDLMGPVITAVLRGDAASDAYAMLMPQYGFRKLVDMLIAACDSGAAGVPDAPRELFGLMEALERVPEWLDMELVEEGAQVDRNFTANVLPYIMQIGFIGTFMNKYSALPMALTGTLSNSTARRRVLETSIFMVTTAQPRALVRGNSGFKACAMVRLMHSMVRVNALTHGLWDSKVYGVPIPQADQMPAGMALVYFMAKDVLKAGRTEFTRAERARVEHSRYRAYLLGLPENLLRDTPQGIVDMFEARQATLRAGYDETVCGGLVRATLAADLASDDSWRSRMRQKFSYSFGKLFFLREFAAGDKAKARSFGVVIGAADWLRIVVMLSVIVARTTLHTVAARIPGMRTLSDRHLVRRLEQMLTRYGHADFISDGSKYKPAIAA